MPPRTTPAPVGRKASTKPEPPKVNGRNLVATFAEWLGYKTTAAELSEREAAWKIGLKGFIEAQVAAGKGYIDEKGSLYVDLPTKVGDYVAIKNQKSVKTSVNLERATELVESKGLQNQCYRIGLKVTDQEKAIAVLKKAKLLEADSGMEIETYLDQDALQAAYYQDLITEEELDSVTDTSVTYSFIPVKD